MRTMLIAVAVLSLLVPAVSYSNETEQVCAAAVMKIARSYMKAKAEGISEQDVIDFVSVKIDEAEAEGAPVRIRKASFIKLIRVIYAEQGEAEAARSLLRECVAMVEDVKKEQAWAM